MANLSTIIVLFITVPAWNFTNYSKINPIKQTLPGFKNTNKLTSIVGYLRDTTTFQWVLLREQNWWMIGKAYFEWLIHSQLKINSRQVRRVVVALAKWDKRIIEQLARGQKPQPDNTVGEIEHFWLASPRASSWARLNTSSVITGVTDGVLVGAELVHTQLSEQFYKSE